MKITLESCIIQDIPTLSIAASDAQNCPVIFFIHGFGGSKEDGFHLGYQLAQEGLFFLSFDPLYHGERYDPRLEHSADPNLGGIYPAETGMDTFMTMYRVIHQCLADTRLIITHLAKDPRVDITHCGVTDPSMGGYARFLIFADLKEMIAAVPMIGIPKFFQRWKDLLDECAYSNPAWSAAMGQVEDLTREFTDFVQEIDPYPRLRAAAPRALLILNCDFDSDQPKLYSIYTYRELLQDYQSTPENLQLRIYPAGHQVTPEMEKDAVNWLCRHLTKKG